jgi:nitrous oxide reductase accessory protein NosL
MLANQLISLLSFNAFTRGDREDDLTINPANIAMITEGHRSITALDGGKYHPTRIFLVGRPDPVEVAQSREFIAFQVNRTRQPEQKYVRDRSQRSVAK